MTGAPLPAGADAVCMIEETETASDGRHVVIGRALQPGNFVRQPGRDVAIGDVIAAGRNGSRHRPTWAFWPIRARQG